MFRQGGAALLDTKLAIAASVLICVATVATAAQYVQRASLAASVSNAVDITARAALNYYSRQIEVTRCLSSVAPTLAMLVSQGYLQSNAVTGGGYTIGISYAQSAANRPVRLDILVTLASSDMAGAIAAQLENAGRPSANSIIFSRSMLPAHPTGNEWSNFNTSTRCYQ